MSAWIVSRAHIDVVVRGLCESEWVTEDPSLVGRALWRENLASVAYRYPRDGDGERPGPNDFRDIDVETYVYRRPVDVPQSWLLNAIHCLDYQSCEHPAWEDSAARLWLDALAAHLSAAGVVKGDAPWGIEEDHAHPNERETTT